MNWLNTNIITPFLIAVQFLTSIPILLKEIPTKEQNAISVLFYPIIGLIIGAILYILARVLLPLPVILSSALILSLWVYLTGGLHLDGLADSGDAWVGGYGDKERTLSVMKDPNCGAMGVITLIVCLLLKFSLIYSLLSLNHLLFIFVPMIGRLSVLWLFLKLPYVRAKGLGSDMSQYLSKKILVSILIFYMILISGVLITINHQLALAIFMGMIIFLMIYMKKWRNRIGGMTGDVIGGAIELSEIVVMMAMVGVLVYIQ